MAFTPILKIDPEFAILMQPVNVEETDDLVIDLLNNGCKQPITIWRGYILDGHKRYRLCIEHGIPFRTKLISLDSRASAVRWICCHQLEKPDLVIENRKYLIGKRYDMEKKIAAKNTRQKDKNAEDYKTAAQLSAIKAAQMSQEYHIALGTIKKYYMYSKALDRIASYSPCIMSKVRSGQLKISHENIIEISHLPSEDIHKLDDAIMRGDITHLNYSEIRHEIAWKRYEVQYAESNSRRQQKDILNAEIKKMPVYDPDAEISILTLTIPSWISSITKTQNNASITQVSPAAKAKLLFQLSELKAACERITIKIREAINE